METVRLTASQALVRFLENQYVSYVDMDGKEVEHKFVKGIFMLPGHGNVVGFCNGVEQELKDMVVYQGKNEQGMALAAVGFAKQSRRKQIFACTSSVGPGACNMVTAAATATANNIPVLILPGDIYASRQPDPVLQQMEQPQNLSISAHDAFQAVTKYWGRINRPEQVMTDMISAMRVLTDTANTGAVAVSLPQDVQAEAYDYPVDFFQKRVWRIDRRPATKYAVDKAVEVIKNAKKPLLICGGGVRYAEAHKVFKKFAEDFGIAFGETQAGKSAIEWTHELNLGGLGTTGGIAANKIAHEADVVIGVGTRYTDFTTASKWLYRTDAKFVNINPSEFQAYKMDAVPVVADANEALTAIGAELSKLGYHTDDAYKAEVAALRKEWFTEIERLDECKYTGKDSFTPECNDANRGAVEKYIEDTGCDLCQTAVLGAINHLIDDDAIVCAAAGSLPGDMQGLWRARKVNTYHMEYGYSCMGYEVASALGAKLACPDQEVYAMCGDGSFDMLHSELITSVQIGKKINVMLFDNASYGCINNLQVANGNASITTEKNMLEEGVTNGVHKGKVILVDYAAIGAAYGCKTYTVKTMDELKAAIEDAKKQTVSTLIDMKVLPKTMSKGYEAWWRVGVAEVSQKPEVQAARKRIEDHLFEARHY
ncbi:3D-(3,5/4)-trihydroxycyclohexane-1,2-dione acylhydrolase (decyclizing) [Butyricicoccus sp. 1XD8-22]|nr:3D-(3,5/4)-trihydroxycyclohexane-1,2-dione acylhydrolase (decyclizing) [Butyricicoccus sp. 1XD8-22]